MRARAVPPARAAADGRARPRGPGLATTRAELVLEAFDRRQESLARAGWRACWRCATAGGASPRGARGARARCGRAARRRRVARRRRARRGRRGATSPSRTGSAAAATTSASALRPTSTLFRERGARWPTWAAAAASSWSCCARRASPAVGVERQRAGRRRVPRRGLDGPGGDLLEFLREQAAGEPGRRVRGAGGRAPAARRAAGRARARRTARCGPAGCWCWRP